MAMPFFDNFGKKRYDGKLNGNGFGANETIEHNRLVYWRDKWQIVGDAL